MVAALKGRKSSSSTSRKATRHDDSLFGQDTVEVLLAISEGPISGLKDGAASFRVGDVPLLDKGSNTPNISNFELRLLKGTNPADTIRLNLGGLASPKNVGLELRTANQSIVVQGDKTQIDYIDVRLVVQRLLAVSKEGGEFPSSLDFKIEVKPRSSGVWQVPFTNEPPPPVENTAGASNYRPGATSPGTIVNGAYRETYLAPSSTPPTAVQADGAMWFQTDREVWEPLIWTGGAWQRPTNLARGFASGYDIWTFVDLDGAVRTAWYSPAGTTPPLGTIGGGDYLLTPQSGEEVYSYNETTWVGAQAFATPTPAAPGHLTITGLARSTYPKEFRIPVARINEPYDVRVTRLSAASTKDIFADVVFESIQEVNRDAVSFPDLAIAWLTIKATDTFTQVPEFTGVYRGILVPVPSNHVFNEETNLSEFPGLWDGTFKIAYTNNPAWHAYNFIKNSRYGKNAYFPEVPDMWDFYEFGKHCSAHGIRFNEYIQEPRSISELINYIVGTAGGRYVDRGDGFSTVIWDADDQVAQAIFAPENTIEGNFTYSFTDVAERKNDFKVSFKNPQLNYREDRLRVWDQNTIDNSGRNAEEFVAVGCRDADEAVRRGRLRLATSLTEKIIVNFRTNRIGRYLLPFQVILIADDQSTNVITGRVKNRVPLPIGAVSLPLRDQIYLEAGIDYSVQFTCSDGQGGLKVVSYPLAVAQPGLQSRLTLDRPLEEELPEYAVFSIGAPKPFRITSITEAEDEPDQIEITAIEVNRLKWAFVDGKVELRDLIPLQTGALSKFVYPVTNAKITPEVTPDGTFNLAVTWNPSETKLTRGHRVYYSFNKGPMDLVAEPTETFYRIAGVKMGTHVVSVVAVGLDGTTESAPVTVSYIVSDGTSIRSVGMPSNLRLVDEPESPIFRARDPRFTWDAAEDPLVGEYVVDVLNASGQTLYSERAKGQLLFSFPLATNIAVTGGAALRSFTVRVRAIDSTGAFSNPITLAVTHPAPAQINPNYTTTTESIVAEYASPRGDFAGILFWASKTPGFNPVTTPPSFDGLANPLWYKVEPETTWYCRMAAYDSYGKDVGQLNVGPEQLVKVTNRIIDTQAPDRPEGLTLTTELTTSATGVSMARIDAAWKPVGSENLGTYEFELAEGAGTDPLTSWMRVGVDKGQPKARWLNLQPGKLYAARVRALNGFGFWSAWSDIVTITAAKNLAKPGALTGLRVDASFETAFLSWKNPADLDLGGTEIWEGTSQAPTAKLADVPAPAAFWIDPTLKVNVTRTYWARPVNTSGTPGDWAGPVSAQSPELQRAALAAGIIDATKIAASLAVPQNVTSLPATAGTGLVVLNGELYRWQNGEWTKGVQAPDIKGFVTAEQIKSLNAAQIAGTLSDGQIAGMNAAKLVGQVVASQIKELNAAQIAGQLDDSQIRGIAATKIAGTLSSSQIASLDTIKLVGQIRDTQLADNAVTQAKLASDLSAVGIVTALPNPSGWTGSKVVLFDGKVWRLVNGAWTAGVGSTDITGQITAGQIASLNAAQIAGQLNDGQIASITASKAVGALVNATLATTALTGTITETQIAAGAVTDAKIAAIAASKVTGQLTASQIASVNAAVVAGQLSDGQIASIGAAKVSGALVNATLAAANLSGTLADTQLGGISTTKLIGTVSSDQIASLVSTKLSGQITSDQVASLAANKVAGQLLDAQLSTISATKVSGQLSDAQLAAISTAKLVGTVSSDQIASLAAAKLAGQITGTQITDGAVSTAKILAGAVVAGSIAAGAVTGSKLAIASANFAYNPEGAQGLRGWTGGTSWGGAADLYIEGNWVPAGMKGIALHPRDANFPSGGYAEITHQRVASDGSLKAFEVIGGSTYEISAYGNFHRCQGQCFIGWWDASGTHLRWDSGQVLPEGGASGGALRGHKRFTWIGAAPSNAVGMRVLYRAINQTAPDSFVFVYGMMYAAAQPGQAECSPYVSPGVTVIDGSGIITNSIAAASIVAGSITADRIAGRTIDASKLVAGTITANELGANSVTAAQILAGAVQTGHMTAGTIDANRLVSGSITAGLIAANAITAGKIDASAVTAREVAAGSILASKLSVASLNMAYNSDFGQGTSGWTFATNGTTGVVAAGVRTDYCPAGYTAFFMQMGAGSATGVADLYVPFSIAADRTINPKFPCSAGTVYEASAYLSLPNSIGSGLLLIQFYNSSGTVLAGNSGNSTSSTYNGHSPAQFETGGARSKLVMTAPSGATYFTVTARWQSSGSTPSTTPWLFVSGVMVAQASSAQLAATEVSPYVPDGVTTISGGSILTNSVAADRIVTRSLTAAQIAAGTLTAYEIAARTITAGNLVAGTITGTEIAASTITGGLIAASTIVGGHIQTRTLSAGHLAAGTITAYEIASRTITATNLQAGTITTAEIAAGTIQAGNIAAGAITASKLTLASINLANDPLYTQAVLGTSNPFVPGYAWGANFTTDPVTVRSDYCPSGLRAINVRIASKPTGGVFDFYCGSHDAAGNFTHSYPAVAAQWYEASAYFSVLNAGAAQVILQFLNSSGAAIETHYSNAVTIGLNGSDEKTWDALGGRAKVMKPAPSGTTAVRVYMRWNAPNPNNPADCWFFASGLMVAPISSAQAAAGDFSPFSPGGATILNGATVRTGTLNADRIIGRTITAGLIAVGTLTATEIAGGTITGDRIAGNTIVAANLQAGTLTAREIAAGAITASKLTLTDPSNMIMNGDFTNGTSDGWGLGDGTVVQNSGSATDPGGQYRIRSTGRDNAYSHNISVTPGDVIYASAMVYNENGERANLMALFMDGAGGNLQFRTFAYTDVKNSWTRVEGKVTAPSNCQRMQILLQTDKTQTYGSGTYWGKVQARRAANAQMIVDGTITAVHIAVGSLTGDRITAGTLNGDRIVGGTIQGGHISGRTISADKLVAGTLTATEIATRTLTADKLVAGTITATEMGANSVTAGKVDAGAITAREIAAGSIVTSKLSITTGNIAQNGDMSSGTQGFTVGNSTWGTQATIEVGTVWVASGMRNLSSGAPGGGGTNGYWDVTHRRVDKDGNLSNFPCNGGQLYEFSTYYTCHRCRFELYVAWVRADGSTIGHNGYVGPGEQAKAGGAMRDYPRATILVNAPGDAVSFYVLLRGGAVSGNDPYIFPFGMMYAAAPAGATECSPYIPPAITTLNGDSITTGTLHANKIIARTITAEKIQANAITADQIAGQTIVGWNIASNTIDAVNIKAGTITAREIAAGAITTNKLTVANRELNLVGFNFRYNTITSRIEWDIGSIFYRDDDGGMRSVNINGGSWTPGGNWIAVVWYKGNGNLDFSGDVNYAANTNNGNWVTIGIYSGGSQFYVNYGSTLLDGDRIITNTLHANRIIAGTISADKIGSNQITAGHVQAGAIGVDQLAAGAITAEKIGVGVNSTNLLWNSDFMAGSGSSVPNISGAVSQGPAGAYCGINQSGPGWEPPGMRSLQMSSPGTPNGTIMDAYLAIPAVGGGFTRRIPVIANRRYEISGYVSAHRCTAQIILYWYDAGGNPIAGFGATNVVNGVQSSGPLSAWARCAGMHTTPGNAAYADVTLRMGFNGGDSPYNFWTGIYFAPAQPNQSQYSDWSPGISTVISGGAIATRTLTAEKIVAGSITSDEIKSGSIIGDRIQAGTITGDKIAVNSIYADKIQIGGGQSLTSWMGGPNATQINGGMIAANTIKANQLYVGLRGLNITGFNIRYNTATRRIEWDGGNIYWPNEDGGMSGASFGANGFTVSGGSWYSILWYKGRNNIDWSGDINLANTDPNWVTLATYDNGSGLAVNYGSTIIDGARIITNSIQAAQIAAGAIQADKIAAGAITADKIGTGQVTADKISGGTIQAGTIKLNDDRLVIEAQAGQPRIICRDSAGNLRVLLGQTSGYSPNGGDWGLVIWDNSNRVIFAPSGINGDAIWAGSISAGAIKADQLKATVAQFDGLIVRSAQIGSLVVGNGNIQNNATSQLVSSYNPNGKTASVTLYVRAGAKVRISVQRNGDGSAFWPSNTNTGALKISRDGGPDIFAIPANYMLNWVPGANASQKVLLGHYVSWVDNNVGEGNHTYTVTDDSSVGVNGVYIEVTELAK
ncbi:carbohydrate binding domain-containing protein [Methylobacterium aquaticum]|uniref:Fibronectin type III domain protein n=1 Tax=Methylobacterium aquaticum TaxID=270351 RepID=A0A0C6G2G3_9HYPH|nr:carbohydrate binding domain-containing protein [Methylobacterium aquaticum]BAQ50280.1 fibronectin type III domain protein [Methylobacterium aquaticum]